MTRYLSQKQDNQLNPTSLELPVAIKDGHRYLGVDMSLDPKGAEWAEVDFKDGKFDGIYTDSLAECCALVIIKKDNKGEVEKVWMLHLSGGFNTEQMQDLPESWLQGSFEMIGKYGHSYTQEDVHGTKARTDIDSILERYTGCGLQRKDITFFTGNTSTSLAINKEGYIGLKPDSLPRVGIAGKRTEERANVNGTMKKITTQNYDEEKVRFQTLIKIAPKAQQEKLQNVFAAITSNAEKNVQASTKALIFSRHYLTRSINAQSKKEYQEEMNSMGTGWGKIALLVLSSIFVLPTLYTIPKMIGIFHNNKERNKLVQCLTSEDNESKEPSVIPCLKYR